MRRSHMTALAVLLATALTAGNSWADECPLAKQVHIQTYQTAAEVEQPSKSPTIVEIAAGSKDFSTLVAAVKAAGLVETLQGKGPFTVFAPTNEAFAKLPKGTVETLLKPENKKKLARLLTYHVVAGDVRAAQAIKLDKAKTVAGPELKLQVEKESLMVNEAKVTKADLVASNGVIHVIDTVLMPPMEETKTAKEEASKPQDIVATAAGAKGFQTLVAAVKAAGLVETLQGKGPFTVFAPTDEAFAKLPEGTVESLLEPANREKLVAILTYHVVPGKVMAADVVKLKEGKTANGKKVMVSASDKGVMINKAKVVKTDIKCTNGVIHVIDSVLLPK